MNKKLILVLAATATLAGCKSVTVRHSIPVQVVETHHVHHVQAPRPVQQQVQQQVIVQQHVHVETKVVEQKPPAPRNPPHVAAPQPKPQVSPVPRAQPRPSAPPEKIPTPVPPPHGRGAKPTPPPQGKPVPVMPQPRGDAAAPREERPRQAERDGGDTHKVPPGQGRGPGR